MDNGKLRRKPRGAKSFSGELLKIKGLLGEVGEKLAVAGPIGAYFCTGPRLFEYNAILRSFTNGDFPKNPCKNLCKGNKYVTTLHAVNSGLLKLSKMLPATTVEKLGRSSR